MQLFYKVIPESYKCFIRKVLSDHISCCIFDEAGKYRVTWIVSELKIFGVKNIWPKLFHQYCSGASLYQLALVSQYQCNCLSINSKQQMVQTASRPFRNIIDLTISLY